MAKKRLKSDSRFKRRISEIAKNGVLFNIIGLIPLIWSLFLVLMVIWGLNVSVADSTWYLDNSIKFITEKFSFANYGEAVNKFVFDVFKNGIQHTVQYWEMFLNSCWLSIGGTFMKMVSTICFAYAVARFEFLGRKALYIFVLLQMMLPVYGQTAANYELLRTLGLLDSPLYLLAQGAGHGMFFLITYSFFRNLPSGYEEAAKVDGAGPFRIFWQVMLPLARPIIVALAIMQFISYWNDYQTPLVFLQSYPTLSSVLYLIKDQILRLGLSTPAWFAGIFISILPVAVVFIIFNKQIMENVSIGGLKG